VISGLAQTAKQTQSYPSHLPYAFSNFVWWSDDELHAQLKKRIPGLGDEIAPDSDALRKIREALKQMLKEKGIQAEVQSEEPSTFEFTAERAPGALPPAIFFSILTPEVLVDKVVITQVPEDPAASLRKSLQSREGHLYSSRGDWLVISNATEEMKSEGYLECGQVHVAHDTPRIEGNRWLVNLIVSVTPGPQYHIGSITADGGPLLKGVDLSRFFTLKPGDVAGTSPVSALGLQLEGFYIQKGYADVKVPSPPILDRDKALVSYHLEVTPGPIYHLHSLTIHNLDAEREKRVRQMLGLSVGGVYDGTAVGALFRKIGADPALAGYDFTYIPAMDDARAMVDLTLDFFKISDKGNVTVK
jgi:outer membrane protein assembly factor BamA